MSDTITIQMAQRGVMTLPKNLRDRYKLKPGDSFTLFDLGGVFVMSPRPSEIDLLADRLSQSLMEEGETLETMLRVLREERQ